MIGKYRGIIQPIKNPNYKNTKNRLVGIFEVEMIVHICEH